MENKNREIAILMAAGLGSRMRPLTDTTAKPLIPVNGVPLIETVLAALEKRGVSEIYVVVGYKKEQFASLLVKHPNLHLVENSEYDTKNNINSIAVVADRMASADCFVCEADLYLPDSTVLCRALPQSGYFAKFVPGYSSDWIFETEKEQPTTVHLLSQPTLSENPTNSTVHLLSQPTFSPSPRIRAIHKGGTDCYNMVGISYFKQSDAKRIADAVLAYVRDPAWAQKFWDDVVDVLVHQDLSLTIHEVSPSQIVECDTPSDLHALESTLKI